MDLAQLRDAEFKFTTCHPQFLVFITKNCKNTKWLPSNHLKFDSPLETRLIPTEMKCNRSILVYIRSGGVIGHLCIHVELDMCVSIYLVA